MVERFFTAQDLPPGDPNLWAENSDRTFGWTVKFAVSGTVTGLSIYGPTSSSPTPRAKIFLESNQSLLAFKDYSGPLTGTAWNDITFDSPVSVDANTNYVICYYMQGANNYAHTANFLTSDVTRGNITANANLARFVASTDQNAFPTQTYSGIFFIDVIFQPAGSGGSGVGWIRGVNRHVTVLKRISASIVVLRPGIITALGTGELVNVRVGHSGETFINLDRRTDPDENITVSKYISY